TFSFGKSNRNQHQWGIKPLRRFFLQVGPAQKTQHQTELGKSELCLVPAGIVADLIEQAWKINRLLKAEMFGQGDRRTSSNCFPQRAVPGKNLFRSNTARVKR